MELNTDTKHLLEKLLRRPYLVMPQHIPFLQDLIQQFPYFQPLHLLLARAYKDSEQEQEFSAKAALYNHGHLLHQIIHDVVNMRFIEDFNVTTNPPLVSIASLAQPELKEESSFSSANDFSEKINFTLEIEETNDTIHTEIFNQNIEETQFTPVQHLEQEETEIVETHDNPSISSNELIESNDIENSNDTSTELLTAVEDLNPQEVEFDNNIEQKVIEEEMQFAPVQQEKPANYQDTPTPAEFSKNDSIENINTIEKNQIVPEIENLPPLLEELEKLGFTTDHSTILDKENQYNEIPEEVKEQTNIPEITENSAELSIAESLISSDFFVLDQDFQPEDIESETTEIETHIAPKEEIVEKLETPKDTTVSRYDDNQLPFSFLWWLSKTRNQHQQNYRVQTEEPVLEKKPKVDELQHQFVEHIFHLETTILEDKNISDSNKTNSKKHQEEDEIIENFIKNDPQIKAPNPNQVNTENKAKQSAEDHYDLVSETLAQIYIEQMLYHKAIDTYQKLSLKFPEKSRYFADLITSLEKKI